jgi:hypothetical protein
MRIIAIALFVILVCLQSAHAQKTYTVGVSVHESLQNHKDVRPLTVELVRQILADASQLLQKQPKEPDPEENVSCDVAFELRGEVSTFRDESKDDLSRVEQRTIDTVHAIRPSIEADFYVKVVNSIMGFCRFPAGLFNGCAFPPNFRSIIVVHPDLHIDRRNFQPVPQGKFPDHRLWAHEFGHLTGLGHRDDDERALMTHCPLNEQLAKGIADDQVRVSKKECMCLRWGPGFGPDGQCDLRGPSPKCPAPQ